MWSEAIAGSLPMSVGVALSPLPVAAVIMMLMSARARTNAPAFLLGWIAGILVVSVITFVLPGVETERGDPTVLSGAIRIVLGVVLLLLCWRQWRRRPAPGQTVAPPKLLARLDQIGAGQSLVTGFLLAAISPKNLLLIAAGAATIDSSELGPGGQLVVLVVFTVVASLTVAVPVAAHVLAHERAEKAFGRWKDWLIENNTTMLIVLMIVFGTVLISRGIRIVAA